MVLVLSSTISLSSPYLLRLLKWNRFIAAGYKALFITVDAPVLGQRLNEVRNHLELPAHLSLPNLQGGTHVNESGETCETSDRSHHHPGRDPSNNWATVIPWVKANTRLQIWLKGSKSYRVSLFASWFCWLS